MDQGGGGLGSYSERWDWRRRESRASDFPEPKPPTSLGQSCAEDVSLGKMGTPPFALWGRTLESIMERDGLDGPEHTQSLHLRGHDFEHCRDSQGGQHRARAHLQQEGGSFSACAATASRGRAVAFSDTGRLRAGRALEGPQGSGPSLAAGDRAPKLRFQ